MPAKKTAIKKTSVKKAAPKTIAPAGRLTEKFQQTTLLKWLFVPDIAQGIGKWMMRAGLFLVLLILALVLFGGIATQMQFVEKGFSAPGFFEMVKMTIDILGHAFAAKPMTSITILIIAYAIGMFAFMPRKYLDKTSFVSAMWTFAAWITVFGFAVYLSDRYLPGSIKSIAGLSLAVLMLIAGIGFLASITCYARKIGVSKLAVLLSMPFGWSFFEYSGYFLPADDKNRTIVIKYNWYKRFVGFMLDTHPGQIIIATAALALLASRPSMWNAFIMVFFGGLYLWKKKEWMIASMRGLSWVVAAFNIAMCAGAGYMFGAAELSSAFAG